MSKGKRIFCFDLDGTLCTSENGEFLNAKPLEDRIKKVNEMYDSGNIIIIETARGTVSKTDWSNLTRKQLSEWGVKYHGLRTGKKIYADHYIDDHAINANDFFV